MFTHWNDFDRTFDAMDTLLRRVFETGNAPMATGTAYRGSHLVETDEQVILTTDLPGVKPDDVDISLHDGVLTVQAERKLEVPEGYEARRLERGEARFARTYTLPTRVDPERTAARLENGVLTVRMEKAVDARPRRIAINA